MGGPVAALCLNWHLFALLLCMRKKERGPKVPQDKRDIVDLAELDASIARGIADADAGRVHPAAEVFDELREWIRRKAETRS